MSEFDQSYFEANYRNYRAQNPVRKLDHYLEVISELMENDFRALDVGCGLGLWAAHMAQANPTWSVSAMDLDGDLIARNASEHTGVTFHIGGVGDPITTTEKFNLITSMDVLEHVPDIDTRFPKLVTSLEVGGFLVAVMPVYDGPLGPVVRALDHDPTHIHKWHRSRWIELFSSHLVDVRWHGLFRYLLPGDRYMHLPTVAFRSIAPAILVVGRRG